MTSPTTRRPLPALVFLLALTLLAALVWWRVLNRDGTHHASTPTCPTSQAPKKLPEPAAITVTVLNSTKRQGIAATARRTLIKDGFRVPEAAANDAASFGGHGVIAQVGEIRYGPLGRDAAKLVRYYLAGARMVATKASDSTVLLVLGAQYKALASNVTVTAALKADGITLTRTSGTPDVGAASPASC